MKQQQDSNEYVKKLAEEKYKYGFTTDVHTDIIDRGLTEDTVRLISDSSPRRRANPPGSWSSASRPTATG